MILYNVTINIDEHVHDEWLSWMKHEHIPMVMETGYFVTYKLFRIMHKMEGETGHTYSVQFFAANVTDYETYRDTQAPRLQEITAQKYGGRFAAFRTVLEEV
ncbi:MAG: DUF4286 family protein [Sphingobacteriales bacterium]|nr:MAG: DUF4286 family protein [Sphingobacteriales bacterium]